MSANLTIAASDDLNGDTFGAMAQTGVEAGIAGGRAIVFNGSTQFARVTFPNSAPFNALGAFQITGRFRGVTTNTGIVFTIFNTSSELDVVKITIGGGVTRFDLRDNRDGLDLFHTVNTPTNVVLKLQYDPANTRWTLESWKADGTGYVSGTVALTTTSNFNFGSPAHTLTIASNGFGATAFSDPHVDWFCMKEGVEAMGSGNFPGAEPLPGTYILKYTFDADTGADTSGNALNLTLTGSPAFEGTP